MTSRAETIRRHPERARSRRTDLDAVLDAGHNLATLSTVVDGLPWVVPMLYARVGDLIVLHGSTGAGALRHVAEGAPVALCVAHIDAWIYAETLFDSSANYRSAVVRGRVRTLAGPEAARALTALSDRMLPGRSAEVPDHTRKQLAATTALVLPIVEGEWTVKVRDLPPATPPAEGVDPLLWTGLLPIVSGYGDPVPAAHIPAEVPLPASIRARVDARGRG